MPAPYCSFSLKTLPAKIQPNLILLFSFFFLASITCNADRAANFGGYNQGSAQGQSTAVDSSGNSYLLGSFDDSPLVFGGVSLNRIGPNDLYITKLDTSGNVVWAKSYGGTYATMQGASVAVDGSGNVYLTGTFQDDNLTNPALTLIGSIDIFVFKLDSSGNLVWAKNFGGSGANSYGLDLSVDSTGNVYVAGSFKYANLTTPALTAIGTSDALVIKLDSGGNVTWAKNFGGSGASTSFASIAVDSSGNIYTGGDFTSADLTAPSITKIGTRDSFAMKLDSSGNSTWAQNFGGSGSNVYGFSIAVDSGGNVYLGGTFNGANLTTPSQTKIGNTDTYVFKLTSGGATTWSKNFGGSGSGMTLYGLAVDGSGNVYLGGAFQWASLTTPSLTKIGTQDAFVIKLDSSGSTQWSQNFGGSGSTAAIKGLELDGSGNLFLGGDLATANLTSPPVNIVGLQDTFIIKMNSVGVTTWLKSFGGFKPEGNVYVRGITNDSSGNTYVVGYFDSAKIVLGSVTINRIGNSSAYVAKVNSHGTVVWAQGFSGTGATLFGQAVAVDSSGNVYVGGHFQSANLTVPSLTKVGATDTFIVKLNSSGTIVWSKRFGGASANMYCYSLAVDGSGNVYSGGAFTTASLSSPVLTKIGSMDSYAMKLDSTGSITWAKNFGGSGATTTGPGIAIDSSGNVFLGGYFSTASLTTPPVTRIGVSDASVIKLDSSGNVAWTKNFGGSGASAFGQSIAVDSAGNAYLGGYFQTANLTTPAFTRIGTRDTFVIKIDSSGGSVWSQSFGGSGASMYNTSVAVDVVGSVYVGGYFNTASITTPAMTKLGAADTFAIKLNSSGTTVWSKNFGGPSGVAQIYGLAADGNGNVHLAGEMTTNLTTPALSKIGTRDLFSINTQLFNTSCTTAGKIKFDSANNVMVFCDGSFWQSMNNDSSSSCTGTTNGKLTYKSNGPLSDFVWYAGSCRSAKNSSTTYGACTSDGKFVWDSGNSTIKGCINGTWTSLKGW